MIIHACFDCICLRDFVFLGERALDESCLVSLVCFALVFKALARDFLRRTRPIRRR